MNLVVKESVVRDAMKALERAVEVIIELDGMASGSAAPSPWHVETIAACRTAFESLRASWPANKGE
jgi:hypothetical protein